VSCWRAFVAGGLRLRALQLKKKEDIAFQISLQVRAGDPGGAALYMIYQKMGLYVTTGLIWVYQLISMR
jgi:hypothetical protein